MSARVLFLLSVLLERDCNGRWNREEVEAMKKDVRNILRDLGMLDSPSEPGFKMELKQLQYFVAAVDMGSMNRAAESLYITQDWDEIQALRLVQADERELAFIRRLANVKGKRLNAQSQQTASIISNDFVMDQLLRYTDMASVCFRLCS